MSAIESGARVYAVDGREAEYVAPAGGRHVVRMIYGDPDDAEGEFHGDPLVIDRVFTAPPVERLHADIARLHGELEEVATRVRAARAEEAAVKAGAAQRAALLAQHRATARIVDFLDGKITHFVIDRYSEIRISPATEALQLGEREQPGDMKLMTLYGKKGAGFEWRINTYSDGSGSETTAIPCRSLEEAQSVACELVAKAFADENAPLWSLQRAAANAARIGAPVPQPIAERLHAEAVRVATEALEKADAEATKARAALAALTRSAS